MRPAWKNVSDGEPGVAGSHYPARPNWSEIVVVLQKTFCACLDDNVTRLGACLAFYTLLSIAPLLIVMVAVAALAYGKEAAQGQLMWQISGLMGTKSAAAIQQLIQSAYSPGAGAVATILGILTLFFGASSVVLDLQDSLNTIWHVPSSPSRPGLGSMLVMLKERLFSFGLILGAGVLLLISVALNTAIAAVGKVVETRLPAPEILLHVATSVISFLVITFLFAAIYKIMPDVKLKWSDVIVGACFTSLLFTIGKQLIAIYLGKVGITSTYGAAGSLVAVLVWVYYSAQLFFMGAEFTKIYTKKHGSQNPGAPPEPAVSPVLKGIR